MKAMVLPRHAPIHHRPLEPRDLPDPEPGAGEILVRVRVCALCRTDLHVIEEDLPSARLPIVPGHQVVGVVERCGDGCRRFSPGDRVGIAWLRWTCGKCGHCVSGSENLCEASRYTGYHEHGGYAEKAVVHEEFAYAIPETFSDVDAAPLLCAGIIGYRALRRSEVPAGGRLGLYGFGSSAHVVMQIARHRGCEVLVATRGESHRELARGMGAGWVGDTFDPMPEAPDGSIIFAPVGTVVPAALRSVRKGGTVAMAGIYMSPVPEMDYDTCLFHEKNLRSVEANTRNDGEELLREAAEIPIRPTVTTFTLDEANDALIRLKEDRIDGTGILVVDDA
jgi:propanol-preferring alcohol dehydrogenase